MLILTKLQKFFAATTWDRYFPHIWFSMKRLLTDKSLPPSVDKYFDEWSLSYIRMHFSESVLNVLDLKGNSKLQLLHSKNSGCVPSNDIANPFCAAIKNMHRLITEKQSLNFFFWHDLGWRLSFQTNSCLSHETLLLPHNMTYDLQKCWKKECNGRKKLLQKITEKNIVPMIYSYCYWNIQG